MHSVPTLRYPSGHWQVKAPSELIHCWLGWQSCSSRSHSSTSAFVGEMRTHVRIYVQHCRETQCICWRVDYGAPFPPFAPKQLKPFHHAETYLLSHKGHRNTSSSADIFCPKERLLKLSSCSRVRSSKFFHCLSAPLLTHARSHPHMPPVPTPASATCPSQSVASTINAHNHRHKLS